MIGPISIVNGQGKSLTEELEIQNFRLDSLITAQLPDGFILIKTSTFTVKNREGLLRACQLRIYGASRLSQPLDETSVVELMFPEHNTSCQRTIDYYALHQHTHTNNAFIYMRNYDNFSDWYDVRISPLNRNLRSPSSSQCEPRSRCINSQCVNYKQFEFVIFRIEFLVFGRVKSEYECNHAILFLGLACRIWTWFGKI